MATLVKCGYLRLPEIECPKDIREVYDKQYFLKSCFWTLHGSLIAISLEPPILSFWIFSTVTGFSESQAFLQVHSLFKDLRCTEDTWPWVLSRLQGFENVISRWFTQTGKIQCVVSPCYLEFVPWLPTTHDIGAISSFLVVSKNAFPSIYSWQQPRKINSVISLLCRGKSWGLDMLNNLPQDTGN